MILTKLREAQALILHLNWRDRVHFQDLRATICAIVFGFFCTNFVSMLVIETMLMYLVVFTLCPSKKCVQTTLSMLASKFFKKQSFVLTWIVSVSYSVSKVWTGYLETCPPAMMFTAYTPGSLQPHYHHQWGFKRAPLYAI